MQLDNELKQQLLNLIKEGKDIPESFKNLLFPPKEEPKEIELKYGIKEREEDILADTMAMPFQPVKQFRSVVFVNKEVILLKNLGQSQLL